MPETGPEEITLELAKKITRTLLYEGYILYPYGPSSLKNSQRWAFGVLYPQAYSQEQTDFYVNTANLTIPSNPYLMQTDCLLEGTPETEIEIQTRFLQLTSRTVGEILSEENQPYGSSTHPFRRVGSLTIDGRTYYSWQEAIEREVQALHLKLSELCARPHLIPYSFESSQTFEPLPGRGTLVREREKLVGTVEISARVLAKNLYAVVSRVANLTPLDGRPLSHNEVLLRSFLSTHMLFLVKNGVFFSLLDPPEWVKACTVKSQNIGTWPVLIGNQDSSAYAQSAPILLSSPIFLYDFPQIAPESPGDLFDATEIDEILCLRIMTLSDIEKKEMRESDPNAGILLDRIEAMTRSDLERIHGVFRKNGI